MDTVISHNDLVTHRVHRHEPPVTAQPINLLHVDQELVVLDKPASIPVSSVCCVGREGREGGREGEREGGREGGRGVNRGV